MCVCLCVLLALKTLFHVLPQLAVTADRLPVPCPNNRGSSSSSSSLGWKRVYSRNSVSDTRTHTYSWRVRPDTSIMPAARACAQLGERRGLGVPAVLGCLASALELERSCGGEAVACTRDFSTVVVSCGVKCHPGHVWRACLPCGLLRQL